MCSVQRELAWAEEMKRERERFGLEPGPHWQQQFGDRRISFLPRNVCFPIPLPLPLQTNHLKQKRHAHTMLHDFFRVMRMQWGKSHMYSRTPRSVSAYSSRGCLCNDSPPLLHSGTGPGLEPRDFTRAELATYTMRAAAEGGEPTSRTVLVSVRGRVYKCAPAPAPRVQVRSRPPPPRATVDGNKDDAAHH